MRIPQLMTSGGLLLGSALLLLHLAAPNLLAQERNPRVTLFGGASFLKAQRIFLVAGEAFRTTYSDGGKLGVRGTVNISSRWALEGAYSYGTSNLRVLDLEAALPRERGFGVRLQQLTGNVLSFLNEQGNELRPFVTAGLGWARYSPTSEARTAAAQEFIAGPAALSSNNKLDFNFGAGAEWKLTRLLGARLDVRDHVTKIPRLGLSAGRLPVAGAAEDLDFAVAVVFCLTR